MSDRAAVNYVYDGSFDGLLCCVFESFAEKEIPESIMPDTEEQLSFFEIRYIETRADRADRVGTALKNKVSREAYYLVNRAYLSCEENKERNILEFVHLCFKIGAKACTAIGHECVTFVRNAARRVSGEAGLYLGFVRFSEINGALVSVIEPKNCVLPIISHHFCDRFPQDVILMYDKTHKMIMLAQNGKYRLAFVESFDLPEAEGEERSCRELWRCFYDTVAVEGRLNPKCRMSHMPKRYWGQMTEFQESERKPENKTALIER